MSVNGVGSASVCVCACMEGRQYIIKDAKDKERSSKHNTHDIN